MSELRTIVVSMSHSMKPLVSTIMLLALVVYVVGIYFTQITLDYRIDNRASRKSQQMEVYFGSVGTAVMSLFQTVTGGLEWRRMLRRSKFDLPSSDVGDIGSSWTIPTTLGQIWTKPGRTWLILGGCRPVWDDIELISACFRRVRLTSGDACQRTAQRALALRIPVLASHSFEATKPVSPGLRPSLVGGRSNLVLGPTSGRFEEGGFGPSRGFFDQRSGCDRPNIGQGSPPLSSARPVL